MLLCLGRKFGRFQKPGLIREGIMGGGYSDGPSNRLAGTASGQRNKTPLDAVDAADAGPGGG